MCKLWRWRVSELITRMGKDTREGCLGLGGHLNMVLKGVYDIAGGKYPEVLQNEGAARRAILGGMKRCGDFRKRDHTRV